MSGGKDSSESDEPLLDAILPGPVNGFPRLRGMGPFGARQRRATVKALPGDAFWRKGGPGPSFGRSKAGERRKALPGHERRGAASGCVRFRDSEA